MSMPQRKYLKSTMRSRRARIIRDQMQGNIRASRPYGPIGPAAETERTNLRRHWLPRATLSVDGFLDPARPEIIRIIYYF